MRTLAHCTTALLVTLLPIDADAASPRELLEQAVAAYAKADFERSLDLLGDAARDATIPEQQARIELYRGANLVVLGQKAKARKAFAEALGHDPTVEAGKERFNSATVAVFARVKAKLRGTLVVEADQPDATVTLDGEPVGGAPLEKQLSVGAYQLKVVSADGALEFKRRVVVVPNQRTEVTARLRPPPPAASASSGPDSPGDPTTATPAAAPAKQGGRLWTWIALGGAVVTAGIGTALGLIATGDFDDWETKYDKTPEDPELSDLQDSIESKATAATVLFVAAGVLAATSVALFFVEGRAGRSERASSRTRLYAGPGGAGLTISF